MGGAAMEVDWAGKILWEVRRPDHHHDGRLLRNGNIILLCARELPNDIAKRVRGGRGGTKSRASASGRTFWSRRRRPEKSCGSGGAGTTWIRRGTSSRKFRVNAQSGPHGNSVFEQPRRCSVSSATRSLSRSDRTKRNGEYEGGDRVRRRHTDPPAFNRTCHVTPIGRRNPFAPWPARRSFIADSFIVRATGQARNARTVTVTRT